MKTLVSGMISFVLNSRSQYFCLISSVESMGMLLALIQKMSLSSIVFNERASHNVLLSFALSG